MRTGRIVTIEELISAMRCMPRFSTVSRFLSLRLTSMRVPFGSEALNFRARPTRIPRKVLSTDEQLSKSTMNVFLPLSNCWSKKILTGSQFI